MTTTASEVLVHPWQDAGLGIAPFRVHCIISTPGKGLLEHNVESYNSQMAEACCQAKALGVELYQCQYCYECLQNNVVIRDANKKFFVVGLDCAMKTGDTQVMTQAKNLERLRQKEIRAKKAEALREAKFQARQATLAAERTKNGGKTDYEVAKQARYDAQSFRRHGNIEKYRWLLAELDKNGGEFVKSMIEKIENYGFDGMSEKCERIIVDIYAKTVSGSRYGSKKYNAAAIECCEKIDEVKGVKEAVREQIQKAATDAIQA